MRVPAAVNTMQTTQPDRTKSRRLLFLAAAATILAAPSLWFVTTFPPLWRDFDAYVQTTAGVDPATVLLHGPLYTFVARLPLFLGYLLGSGGAGARSLGDFLLRPTLTDSGVFVLVLLQHAALLAAQFYLVIKVARAGWIRVLLALGLAANPMLYAFAHCVGSEALSAIGCILLTAIGLRIARDGAGTTLRAWGAFAIVVVLLMLTRQINSALAGLLPLALFPLLHLRRGTAPERGAPPGLRPFLTAAAIGAACFAISVGCVRLIASNAEMPYRSKIGYTFVWRLKFLQELSPAERTRVVSAAAGRARSSEAKGVIEALDDLFANRELPDVTEFIRQQRAALIPPGTPEAAARIDYAMNEMPLAFLQGSPVALVNAATEDLFAARQTSVWRLTEFLFEASTYYFKQPQAMPQLAQLVTYRGATAEQIMAGPRRHAYLRWWNAVTYDRLFVGWVAALATLLWLARTRRGTGIATASYATALLLTGLLMMLANCFLTEPLPRYTLPMFELTFLSLMLLLSHIAEAFSSQPHPSVQ